tara:strand:- start:3938 stop:4333 length:396 start_codon:yes stop_codon:yes gene_type:complete
MSELEKVVKEVKNGFQVEGSKKEITIDDIVAFFTGEGIDNKNQINTGRVYQKNKEIKLIDNIFKILEEEIKKIETKNNKDLDNSFFNLNKKILSTNMYNLKEIINLYDIDEKKIIYFLIGTVIQSIYDKKD